MGRSVAETQAAVDSYEFTAWMVLDGLSPGEPFRSDYRMASLCAFIASMFSSKKGNRVKVEDFLLNTIDYKQMEEKGTGNVTSKRDEVPSKLKQWVSSLKKSFQNKGTGQ